MFQELTDYPDFFSTMLNVAGVLLGLAFSSLLFILSGGFKEFPSSRRMFLKLYVKLGTNLLTSLTLIVVLCFGGMFLNISSGSFGFVVLALTAFWLKSLLDYKSQRGYIQTLDSNKFCPSSYGGFRRYFRYIRNLGIINLVILVVECWILLIYPLTAANDVSEGLRYSHWIFVMASVHFVYSLARIIIFIPQFFYITKTEYENVDYVSDVNGTGKQQSDIDYTKEHELFRKHLLDHGFEEIEAKNAKGFKDGEIFVNYLSADKKEAWMNVHISCSLTSLPELLKESLGYGRDLLIAFKNCGCDLNEIVLSYHFSVDGLPSNDCLFFRVSRSECEELNLTNNTSEVMLNIKNSVIDPIWRGQLQ